jgi:DUF2075 family protein
MLIYRNTTQRFVSDVLENKLTKLMSQSFIDNTGHSPTKGELTSWQNSLSRVKDLIQLSGLEDNMIALEYECPYTQSRIDCLLFGKAVSGEEAVLLLELKQWTDVIPLTEEGNFEEVYEVETVMGNGSKIVAHPSQQIKGYQNYLKGFVTTFEDQPALKLFSCAYCHNYEKIEDQGLFSPVYSKIIAEFPIYTREDALELAEKMKTLLAEGKGFEIFNRFLQSPIRPSKKLLENVSRIIKNEVVFSLIKEQIVAKNLIWGKLYQALKTKSIVIVHGGPGTGKSLIALNVLAEAAHKGIKVFYGCKSKPFINGLQHLVKEDGKLLFSNLYRFLPSKMKENELDLLLVDEAHRVEKSSNFQYTKPVDKTDMPQIDQLIRCSKTVVFFIDDKQNVRSQEIGSSDLIREAAAQYNIPISDVTLETQYRCMGSNNYLLWLESVLGYDSQPRKLLKSEIFDFQIFDSPKKLYNALQQKKDIKGNTARLVAGFCWPWSDPDNNGDLVRDVVIDDFSMPWEAKENFKLSKGIPKWYEWAYKEGGFDQVGCIYTVQGFEFDYIGVIIGNDLTYNSKTKELTANIKATCDPTLRKYPASFENHIRNIYRTLLTRGMKGCYVFFTDKETEAHFRSRIEI